MTDILSHLIKTNPSKEWSKQKITAAMRLHNGLTIKIRFDLDSAGRLGELFTRKEVMSQFGKIIEEGMRYTDEEYVRVCDEVSLALTEDLCSMAEAVMEDCRLSHIVLDALQASDYEKALYSLTRLLGSLGNGIDANKIWKEWFKTALVALKTIE